MRQAHFPGVRRVLPPRTLEAVVHEGSEIIQELFTVVAGSAHPRRPYDTSDLYENVSNPRWTSCSTGPWTIELADRRSSMPGRWSGAAVRHGGQP